MLPYGTATMHLVPDRVKPSFVIFHIRALWRSIMSVRSLQLWRCTYSSPYLSTQGYISLNPFWPPKTQTPYYFWRIGLLSMKTVVKEASVYVGKNRQSFFEFLCWVGMKEYRGVTVGLRDSDKVIWPCARRGELVEVIRMRLTEWNRMLIPDDNSGFWFVGPIGFICQLTTRKPS